MYFILNVDDAFFLGEISAVQAAIINIRKAFAITTQESFDKYLICKFTLALDERTIFITQTFLINKIIKNTPRTYQIDSTIHQGHKHAPTKQNGTIPLWCWHATLFDQSLAS